MILPPGGRGGGENITRENISNKTEKDRLISFSLFFVIGSLLQVIVVLVEAFLLGRLSGIVFVMTALLMSFKLGMFFDGVSLRVGLYLQHLSDRTPNVKVSQLLFGITGMAIIVIIALGYWPSLWQWRLMWYNENYIIISKFFNEEWYIAGSIEVLARVILIGAIPFVLWSALHVFKWSARQELVNPAFSHTPFGEIDPSSIHGPNGEIYKPSIKATKKDNDKPSDKPKYEAEALGE